MLREDYNPFYPAPAARLNRTNREVNRLAGLVDGMESVNSISVDIDEDGFYVLTITTPE